jgi:arsenate reductase (thioredoxin)
MNTNLKQYCDTLVAQFDEISPERKALLEKLSTYIQQRIDGGKSVQLVYICTHNSRRSHFGQIWAQAAAAYYQIANVQTYSGGTEATAFHPNAIAAFQRVGFRVEKTDDSKNPRYKVFHSDEKEPIICFSKTYDDAANPKTEFAAIMTCSDAEENCPFIPGVDLRIGTTYNDPKAFDGTPQQDEKYSERCRQIALECLFVFSKIN